jgi:hypothetical protein
MEGSIGDLTDQLRRGGGAFWQRLREELRGRGIDPGRSVLVESYEDDYRVESGILITPDSRVLRYSYDFYRHGDVSRGTFTSWIDLTDHYAGTPYESQIDAALAMLEN